MVHPPLTAEQEASLREMELDGLGEGFRAAVAHEIDVVDDVMLAVAINAAVAHDVDVADDVMLAVALNAAVAHDVDVADDVMLAVALNAAVANRVDVADAVMAAIGAHSEPIAVQTPMPRWASLGVAAAVFAAAAIALFSMNLPVATSPVEVHAKVEKPAIVLAAFNDARVEELVAGETATVSVMQLDEGGPTIIFVADEEG